MPRFACSNLPEVTGGGSGEGTFFVAEEFGFDELAGDCGAVQGDERMIAAWTSIVSGSRDEFFASSGFTQNANARFAGGDAIHLGHHAAHRFAFPYDFVIADASTQFAIFRFEALQAQRVFDGEQKLVCR